MDTLKKFFPLSFKYIGSVSNLIIGVLVYLLVAVVGGFIIGLAAFIPIVGLLCGIVGGLLELYIVAGIVIQFLAHFKVLKD